MIAKYGIADPKKSADWISVRDPDVKKFVCTGTPTTQLNYFMLKIYYQKFGHVENPKFVIVSAQLVSGTRNVQKDLAGNSYFTVPLMVDWIEVPVNSNLYVPPIPNLSERFYLPNVRIAHLECSLPILCGQFQADFACICPHWIRFPAYPINICSLQK